MQIALAHSHLVGLGFDLPALTATFEGYMKRHQLSDRVRFLPGDFFVDPLPPDDVVIMGRVFHNWDLATKRMLCRRRTRLFQPAALSSSTRG